MSVTPDAELSSRPSRRLWVTAAVVALGLHLGGVALAIASRPAADAEDDLGAPGLEIGLELAAPRAEVTDLPPGPNAEASAASPSQVEQKAVEKQSELPKEMPAESDNPDRIVSPDATKKPTEENPDTPTAQASPSTESVASEATAMPTSETAKESERSTTLEQGIGESRQRVRTTWQKQLVAHLDRHKKYPSGRESKSAEIMVAFELDRTGHILSSSIVKSSGDPAFDQAALAMLKRSDPVPAPPPLVADDSLYFTLPVIFRVKTRG
ncbi:energy transducer TonB [Bradyrhizobium sp. U87765 SZCCT0131]|uniref:energy transducer TonB family protein n=1 Tax=unclassified Bradyrhizobium TaxID=2631580 RepID=UPI001BA66112|nr:MULTISPECIES: TonB family protein [unclassified Bradyrhizobium]MBR1216581.1 energy transducer TonB [Bradyrhizobium sp. U87765 SZCCT0131]MBR1259663.1 energy transducer TonB [Bradyrhizobium sp. U87765 SZCCT0134]MBR1305804.1 energy transducer TonB [Bradyrhizobium sp. U87765 SZCCT0110]MBR1322171.1 energy transducer TonB [Bradyrhizobium sp. U87765 SZCCT0109]MBR1350550.1 energy transducer TonB [Bradyrhizobium sp. U87765 SZCCT0048]